MESTLELDLLTPLDWRVLRTARLYALLDSSDASPRAMPTSRLGELEWQRLFDAATWIVARDTERYRTGKSVSEPGRPASRHVESAWVAPAHRRRGVLRTVLHRLVQNNRLMGVSELMLWVLEDNHDAQHAYEALGFEPTGERQFLPAFGRFERRLRLEISGARNF
jgi:GNAT superfamily N-acetyltransferase